MPPLSPRTVGHALPFMPAVAAFTLQLLSFEWCLAIPIVPVPLHALQIYLVCDEAATTPVVTKIRDSYWECYVHIQMRTSLICSHGPGHPTIPPGGHTRPVSDPFSLSTSLTLWSPVVIHPPRGVAGSSRPLGRGACGVDCSARPRPDMFNGPRQFFSSRSLRTRKPSAIVEPATT